ncbi:hypothetical protein DEO72_LG11g2048 [Vigna unguiculata]|uniref:Uncharacterized protein n=1 Tax=Vigna unguiculata TaxID=3917 RepID=A0A4D6NMI3_VIGUN|nr:hypothetical protein DEO72_LG11g2048 [Vigna unguiculata]
MTNEIDSEKGSLKVSLLVELIKASSALREDQDWTSGGTKEVLLLSSEQELSMFSSKNCLAVMNVPPGDASSLPNFLGSAMNRLAAKVNLPSDAW